jgi:queuine/archaeosine tRNA-ribosyltransferase
MFFLKENNSTREIFFPVGGKQIRLPIYLPSISSVKTGKIDPLIYFRILKALTPNFLISAYDIYNSKEKQIFINELKENMNDPEGAIIILDSGNYEKSWLNDDEWEIEKFNSIVREDICDLAFCYDNLYPKDIKKNLKWINNSVSKSQFITSKTTIIPIVHSKKRSLDKAVLGLYNSLDFSMVAIPERELGNGILERIRTITKLRKTLNKTTRKYTFIHILGTGNPLSLLLFSLAGADTFDGLEWCQTVVDPLSALLYHFQQRELVMDNCDFCKDGKLDYFTKTFGHNLYFYNSWMNKIQVAIETSNEEQLLKMYFNENIISELKKIWS